MNELSEVACALGMAVGRDCVNSHVTETSCPPEMASYGYVNDPVSGSSD